MEILRNSLAAGRAKKRSTGRSLGDLVRDEVLRMILGGELSPGQRINEPDIASRLNVSRVPVREALRSLEASGLVHARKNQGVFVRELQPKEVLDLYTFRALLDGYCGEQAACLPLKNRRTLVKELKKTLVDMRTAGRLQQTQAYYSANLNFHWLIVTAADNQKIAQSYQFVIQQLHLCRLQNLSKALARKASIDEHEAIADAISRGDSKRARSLMYAHVYSAEKRFFEMADPVTGLY
jgi:DNA-binding GntR family transcriptional regulator